MRALVVGLTGISGYNTAERLLAAGWEVAGVVPRAPRGLPGVRHVAADARPTRGAVDGAGRHRPTHVFFSDLVATGHRGGEHRGQRRDAAQPARGARDARPTCGTSPSSPGLKHYLGPFEAYAQGPAGDPVPRGACRGCPTRTSTTSRRTSSSRRPGGGASPGRASAHTMIGYALGNAMNMGVTLAVYAHHLPRDRPALRLPRLARSSGTGVTDVTDARAARAAPGVGGDRAGGRDQAFNIVNGDVFRWRRMWPKLAADLGVEAAPYPGHADAARAPDGGRRRRSGTRSRRSTGSRRRPRQAGVVVAHRRGPRARPMETLTDMTKSRCAGFLDYQDACARSSTCSTGCAPSA